MTVFNKKQKNKYNWSYFLFLQNKILIKTNDRKIISRSNNI